VGRARIANQYGLSRVVPRVKQAAGVLNLSTTPKTEPWGLLRPRAPLWDEVVRSSKCRKGARESELPSNWTVDEPVQLTSSLSQPTKRRPHPRAFLR